VGLDVYDDIERCMAGGGSDRLPPSAVVVSGHSVGHIGSAAIIVGFDRLCRAGQLDGPVAVASSTPCAFGFGLITPPATPPAE